MIRFSKLHLWIVLLACCCGPSVAQQNDQAGANACMTSRPSPHFDLGINRTNLGRVKNFQAVLESIKRAGIENVRLTLDAPFSNSVATVIAARRMGLHVLFNVTLWWPEFVATGAVRRLGRAGSSFYDVYRLSDLDIAKYESGLEAIIKQIEAAGVEVQAIQVGNEINWAAFNGDLPLVQPGMLLDQSNFRNVPFAEKIEQGFQKYVAALAATKSVLSRSKLHQHATIIAAGLTYGGSAILRSGASELTLDLAWELLAKYDAQRYVDAYAVHMYPFVLTQNPKDRFREIYKFVSDYTRGCGLVNGSRKPCWITEWGFKQGGDGCTTPGADRLLKMREFNTALACFEDARKIRASYLFDWDQSKDYSIWRCGHLMNGGQIFQR
jgi:hypothetical protein